jgi:hypothetical protein
MKKQFFILKTKASPFHNYPLGGIYIEGDLTVRPLTLRCGLYGVTVWRGVAFTEWRFLSVEAAFWLRGCICVCVCASVCCGCVMKDVEQHRQTKILIPHRCLCLSPAIV